MCGCVSTIYPIHVLLTVVSSSSSHGPILIFEHLFSHLQINVTDTMYMTLCHTFIDFCRLKRQESEKAFGNMDKKCPVGSLPLMQPVNVEIKCPKAEAMRRTCNTAESVCGISA